MRDDIESFKQTELPRRLVLFTLVSSVLACGILSGCSAVNAVAKGEDLRAFEYSSAPPEAELRDSDFEEEALKSANEEEGIEYRWAVITEDWSVERKTDRAGNSRITHQARYLWMGGVVTENHPRGYWKKGDCVYKLMQARKEHMGGGKYGDPKYYFRTGDSPVRTKRLKCETEEQVRAATPPAYRKSQSKDKQTDPPE